MRRIIADVIGRYCHAIDRRCWQLLDACFHADARYDFGQISGSWRAFVAIARTIIDPLPATHHQLGQICYADDGADIRAETYFTATHRIAADAPSDAAFSGVGQAYDAVMAGRYVDIFALRDGQWRIAHRAGIIDARHDVILSGAAMAALSNDALTIAFSPADLT